ncbi:MAG: STAS domain-containing protein [Verrucomicrobiae bacterium]|nr:STAS domain-containing protein [Verrucomicrobiae bacterium]
MSEENSGILVGEDENSVVIRIQGRGTYLNSHLLKEYLTYCLGQSCRDIQLDMVNCTYMDSTFLGMLASVGSKNLAHSLPPIKVMNPTDRIRGMLENLGITHLFEVVKGMAVEADLKPLPSQEPDKADKSREMLEAHEALVAVSKGNEAKFKDVIALLKEKVRKLDDK